MQAPLVHVSTCWLTPAVPALQVVDLHPQNTTTLIQMLTVVRISHCFLNFQSQFVLFYKFTVSSNPIVPSISPDVLRTASLRHQKGLMSPFILHVLNTREVRLPCLMEDESNREFPPIHDVYMPLRQKVYAVLFNLHHVRFMHTKKKGKLRGKGWGYLP